MNQLPDDILVSIIIPVYNVQEYLEECVDSVLTQTYCNTEIIIVDDGSLDNSAKTSECYCGKDSRVVIIHKGNGGLSDARNMGLLLAKGEYVYFLDSDDYIVPETLECLLEAAYFEHADIAFFDAFLLFTDCEEDPKAYRYERKQQYTTTNGVNMLENLLETDEYRTAVQLMMIKKRYLNDNHLAFKKGILHEDELFTGLLFLSNGRVSHVHKELYARRIRQGSIMTATDANKHYYSMLFIYSDLCKKWDEKLLKGDVARLYIIRIAKSVIAKYKKIVDKENKEITDSFTWFKSSVAKHCGFGDQKLKVKCYGGLKNVCYRFCLKIKREVFNGNV